MTEQGKNNDIDRDMATKKLNDSITKEVGDLMDAENNAYKAGFINGKSAGEANLAEIKSRNIELESTIVQKNMRIRHLEELNREKSSGLTQKFTKQKDVDDEQ